MNDRGSCLHDSKSESVSRLAVVVGGGADLVFLRLTSWLCTHSEPGRNGASPRRLHAYCSAACPACRNFVSVICHKSQSSGCDWSSGIPLLNQLTFVFKHMDSPVLQRGAQN